MSIQQKDLAPLAKANGLSHVVVWAFDGYNQYVVSYGSAPKEEEEATNFGNNIKRSLGWPENLVEETPLVRDLRLRIEELEGRQEVLDPNSPEAVRETGFSIKRK